VENGLELLTHLIDVFVVNKEDCIDCLKVYYGIHPYGKHQSKGSGQFYQYIKDKYGEELLEECEKEFKSRLPNCS